MFTPIPIVFQRVGVSLSTSFWMLVNYRCSNGARRIGYTISEIVDISEINRYTVSRVLGIFGGEHYCPPPSPLWRAQSLMIGTRGFFWLESAAGKDKWNWLRSHLYSMQTVPDAYPVRQFSVINFYEGYVSANPADTRHRLIWIYDLSDLIL